MSEFLKMCELHTTTLEVLEKKNHVIAKAILEGRRNPLCINRTYFAWADGVRIRNIYRHRIQVALCGDGREDSPNIVQVLVRECVDGETPNFWGWLAKDKTEFSLIWHSPIVLHMCFPYGIDVDIGRGFGRPAALYVRELADLITPLSHPNHEVVGKRFKGGFKDAEYFCESYDPKLGFWMRNTNEPKDLRNVSERAIGRTYHRQYEI